MKLSLEIKDGDLVITLTNEIRVAGSPGGSYVPVKETTCASISLFDIGEAIKYEKDFREHMTYPSGERIKIGDIVLHDDKEWTVCEASPAYECETGQLYYVSLRIKPNFSSEIADMATSYGAIALLRRSGA